MSLFVTSMINDLLIHACNLPTTCAYVEGFKLAILYDVSLVQTDENEHGKENRFSVMLLTQQTCRNCHVYLPAKTSKTASRTSGQ